MLTPSCPFQECAVGSSGALPHPGFSVKVAAEEEDHFRSHEVTLQINTLVLCDVASSSAWASDVFVHLLAVTTDILPSVTLEKSEGSVTHLTQLLQSKKKEK